MGLTGFKQTDDNGRRIPSRRRALEHDKQARRDSELYSSWQGLSESLYDEQVMALISGYPLGA